MFQLVVVGRPPSEFESHRLHQSQASRKVLVAEPETMRSRKWVTQCSQTDVAFCLLGTSEVSRLRPLVLFPASLLTIAAGILFGLVVGIGVAMAGANI